ncbi:glycosyltransferase (plasmid) [Bacillus sp. 31A1R]|uniref:Glycosyltransferase n=1 Tax=Robertmurraya mangrovi TaxID=3098077 RepID=A0ABU5IV15_9BACI|nr:glycosyltransferase [Bacillus sp. 31A1R]MDZ5470992.1 glycosyltransferase [Bacillus sp. 31A1R]
MINQNFQLVIHSNIPCLDFFNSRDEEKLPLFSFTEDFISLLMLLEVNHFHRVHLGIIPLYYELINHPTFKNEMHIYFQEKERTTSDTYMYWEKYNGNLSIPIRKLIECEKIELLAAPVTFVNLPFLSTSNGLEHQIKTGISIIEDFFLVKPKGFWFPNGSYTPGLDLSLMSEGIEYSFIHHQTIHYADPTPVKLGRGPVYSPHGLIMYPIEVITNAAEIKFEDGESCADTRYLCISMAESLDNQMSLLGKVSPSETLSKLNTELEKVHLCSSFLSEDLSGSFNYESSPFWSESHFIEKDLENLKEKIVTDNQLAIYREMMKEWMLLVGVLSSKTNSTLSLQDYIDRYNELRSYFIADSKLPSGFFNRPILENFLLFNIFSRPSNERQEKILMLTWEYPPNIVGGLSRHVHGLSKALSNLGYEIHIITTQVNDLPNYEEDHGVHVYRVKPLNEKDPDFLSWVGGLNLSMVEKAMELLVTHDFKMIHAHDWLVGAAGLTIKEEMNLPLLATIHATEHGRNDGIYTEMQKFIHNKERSLINGADKVIICSEFMREELMKVFRVSEDKLAMIPNGIDESENHLVSSDCFDLPIDKNRKMIFSIGRMVKEKGFDTLIQAAEKMRDLKSDVYFIVAGKGPLLEEYRRRVFETRLSEQVYFVGFVTDEQRQALLNYCHIAVFPSRYEPFGIVALESMLYSKPTIVSNVGGLKGIVQHQKTGLLMEPDCSESLVEQLSFLIHNEDVARDLGEKGKRIVERLFSWQRVAEETKRVFEETLINKSIL